MHNSRIVRKRDSCADTHFRLLENSNFKETIIVPDFIFESGKAASTTCLASNYLAGSRGRFVQKIWMQMCKSPHFSEKLVLGQRNNRYLNCSLVSIFKMATVMKAQKPFHRDILWYFCPCNTRNTKIGMLLICVCAILLVSY